MIARARAAAGARSHPTPCSSTATPTRRSPARSRPPTAASPVVHVEAGMRSFDRTPARGAKPRADRPALGAAAVLDARRPRRSSRAEAVPGRGRRRRRRDGRRRAGDARRARSPARDVLARYGVEPGALRAGDRAPAANVDDPAALERLVALLEAVEDPVVMPLHPRTPRAAARPRPPCPGGGTPPP